jgi:hypothetical protein
VIHTDTSACLSPCREDTHPHDTPDKIVLSQHCSITKNLKRESGDTPADYDVGITDKNTAPNYKGNERVGACLELQVWQLVSPPPLPPFKMPHILYILPHSVVTCWQLWPHAMVLVHWDEQDHGGFWLHRFCCSTFPQ